MVRKSNPLGAFLRKAAKVMRKPGANKRLPKLMKGKRVYKKKTVAKFLGNIKKMANANMTESKCYQRLRPSKLARNLEKVGVPHISARNAVANFTCGEGRQGAAVLSTGNTQDLQWINTYTSPGTISGQNAVQRFVLEKIVGQLEVTNSSTARAHVDIYDIIRIRDPIEGNPTSTDPIYAWGNGIQNQSVFNGPYTVGGEKIVGCIPTDSKAFKDYFKIIKKTTLVLEQGASHRHYVSRSMQQMCDSEILGLPNGNRGGAPTLAGDIKPYVLYHMVVSHGQVVATNGEETNYSDTTTADVRLDIALTYRMKWSWLNNNTFAYVYNPSLLLNTATNDAIVNAGDGVIETSHYIGDTK